MKHTCLSHDSGPLVLCHVTKQKLKNKTKTNNNETKATENHGQNSESEDWPRFWAVAGAEPKLLQTTS